MKDLSSLEVLLPRGGSLERLLAAGTSEPFGEYVQGFAAALGATLLRDARMRRHPELVALGYWLRPSHLTRMLTPKRAADDSSVALPKGMVFHVAPGNVDTIFVYSWLVSLMCGNRNVVRLSSRHSEQAELLLSVLGPLLDSPQWLEIGDRTLVVRYGHDDVVSQTLSNSCDLRVVWGGDATVAAFRRLPLPPHAGELAFPDRFSLALIGAESLLAENDLALAAFAKAFANDAYGFAQMACSSPRLVVWCGNEAAVGAAQDRFWPALSRALLERSIDLGPADIVNKVVTADALAIEGVGARIADVHPTVTRVWLERPTLRDDLHCGAGLFHETRIGGLDELPPLLPRKVQTVAHHGFAPSDLKQFLLRTRPAGIDRLVPVGSALDFEPRWDGIDLFEAFVRRVTVR